MIVLIAFIAAVIWVFILNETSKEETLGSKAMLIEQQTQ